MTMPSSRRLCSLWSEHYEATCPLTPEPSVSLRNLSLWLNGLVHKDGVTKLYSVSALYFLFSPSYIFHCWLGFFLLWKKSLYASVWSVWPCRSIQLYREQLAASGHTHSHKDTKHTLTPAGSLRCFIYLYFRPLERRRRDVFGVANNSLFHEGGGRGNTTLGTGDNSTDGIPPIKEYPFSEDKSPAEYLEIPHLRPFTVYRIDLHACNEEVGRCSAGAFVFSRTKPAG